MVFDPVRCVEILLNRTLTLPERGAAAESLAGRPEGADALFEVLLDETEEGGLREEAASSLGWTWASFGPDYARLRRIPDAFLVEVLLDCEAEGIVLERDLLGAEWPRIEKILRAAGLRRCLASS